MFVGMNKANRLQVGGGCKIQKKTHFMFYSFLFGKQIQGGWW